MRILFVTLCSIKTNASAAIRNKSLIKGLVQNGNNVDLLTIPAVKESSYYDSCDDWIKDVNIINLNNNIYVSLVRTNNNFIGKSKKRMLKVLRYLYHSFSLFDNTIYIAKKIDTGILPQQYYDVIISSSDPKSSHVAVAQLIRGSLKYGKWIQYWGDPLTLDITQRSVYPKFYKRNREIQLFFCADRIVYVSPITLKKQKKLFPQFANKMDFVPIPYFKAKIYSNDKNNKKQLMLGYFGDYKKNIRNLQPLYNICKDNDIRLVIAGNTDLKLEQSDNIKILPRISQTKVEQLESQCDILICVLNKRGTQIPGKLYHYAGTNKPILVILDGEEKNEIRKYLERFNRYILCENNEDSIKEAIIHIRDSKKEYEPSHFFQPKIIAKQILSLIE